MMQENTPLRRENFKRLHRRHNVWRWLFSTFLAALVMSFVCFFWFGWVRLGNNSMSPSFRSGQLVLMDRLYKYFHEIERTDMVAYRRPGTGELLIKRVVATGGESVSGKNGAVWIDDRYRLNEETYGAKNTNEFGMVKVPDGYVFVLSDDRQYGEDSREADIGCVPLSDILGVVYIRLLPSLRFYE